MNASRIVSITTSLAVLSGLGACAGTEGINMSRPGKYNLYSCVLLNEQGASLVRQEQQLEDLMKKAAQGPGGEIAGAIAYRSEYNVTQGDLREIERVAAAKNCVLKYRSVSGQAVR